MVVSAIERLIREVNAKWVILSYSSGGRATAEELDEVIRRNGKLLEVFEIDYKSNVMASMRWTNEWLRDVEKPHREFLFLIEKRTAQLQKVGQSAIASDKRKVNKD